MSNMMKYLKHLNENGLEAMVKQIIEDYEEENEEEAE